MQRLISLVFASAIALTTIGSGAGAQSSVAYQVQDLILAHSSPDYEVPGVGAYAINNSGVVVGFTADDAIKSSPFYTVDGKPKRVKQVNLAPRSRGSMRPES